MLTRLLMIGAAVAIAAGVLLLSVLAGGPGVAVDEAPLMFPSDDELFLGDPNASDQLPLGESGRFNYESWEGGLLTRFSGERIVPRPQGVADITGGLVVHVELGPGKELIITADQATVVAPDNHPREGEMRGNVIVTLYETPDGSQVDLDSDRDVVMRIYFDDPVQFDLQLQQIDSEGPIFMTGPQVEFRGRGLSLNYNQLRHRIERLVIEHGQSLRYIPDPEAKKSPAARAQATPSAEASIPSGTPRQARPIQFYLAHFEQLQDVKVGQDQYEIDGDDLEAIFSAKAAREIESPADPATPDDGEVSAVGLPLSISQGSIALAAGDPLREALLHAIASSFGLTPTTDKRSLATFSDEDVVIWWSGRLTIVPLSDVPEELAGPDDVMVTVLGSPARIRTDRGETILARRVSFFNQDARLFAQGSDAFPVTLDSDEMGLLTGRELSINQRKATGYVLGPGKLTGLINSDTPDAQPATNPEPRTPIPDPPRFTVTWDDRLDMVFYPKKPGDKADTDDASPTRGSQIKGLKSAKFTGGVVVDHPDTELKSDRLALDLAEDPPRGDDKLAVERLTAIGNVQVFIKDQDTRLTGHHLLAYPGKPGKPGEPGADQLELFGQQDDPARIIRPDATLVGGRIFMNQKGGTLNVMGPGSIDFLQDSNNPGDTVHVTWRDNMHYDDLAGSARFLGEVRTRSTDGTDTNELMGDDLSMTFVPDESKSKSESKPDKEHATRRRLATATMQGNARFRARSYATDKHDVMLTELYMVGPVMTFDDPGPPPDSPPKKSFWKTKSNKETPAQQVQVVGQGRMLITDLRPEDEANANAAGKSKKPGATPGAGSIDLAGRGKTAFQWSERLILDLTHGDMLMKGQVAMVHQPERGDRVQLDCLDLAAELKAPSGKKKAPGSGGGGWLSDDAPQPELQRVWADGGIRLIQGPITVHSDHLLYQESKRVIILWADDPHQVTYEVQGEPTVTKSSAFKWHRDTGRFEAFKLRTGTIPIRRREKDVK